MKRLILYFWIATLLTPVFLHAQAPDQQYVGVYSLIQEADRLNAAGDAAAARSRYIEADTALKKLQASYPTWNQSVVKFRLRYIEEKLGLIPSPAAAETVVEKPQPDKAVLRSDEHSAQIRSLQEALHRLEGEKATLQARLKEALTAQPAAIDPRELAKAEERIRNLEKEKELLRVTLEQGQQQARQPLASGPTSLKDELAEANRKLAEQRELAAAVAREKQVLESRLNELSKENENLRRQPKTEGGVKESRSRSDSSERELAEAKAAVQANGKLIASLRRERDQLEKLRLDLEKRLATANSDKRNREALDRVARLEKERDQLQARVKELSRPAKAGEKVDTVNREIGTLKARLAALEAPKIPYTPEELALFKEPSIQSAKTPDLQTKAPTKVLPASATTLLAEAESAFHGRRYEDAEKKYEEVLKIDQQNSATLANLAAAQMEQKKLAEAEATLKRALAINGNDAHALTLLGILKFRQEKFDEALDSLSRSAQLDPQNAETQNYLGITLSQKGQRGPAEAALRRAIQLSPGYGSAHNNLAVIYATQQPPFMELARWHYQKALSAGHPKNAELEKLLNQGVASAGK